MAQPLNLATLGVEGARNPVDVENTRRLILPFTQKGTTLIVGNGGAVAAESTPEAQTLLRDAGTDDEFFGRVGKSFRTYQ